MTHSENLGELFAALAKAQGQFRPALKSSTMTVTKAGGKAHYADLASIFDACRDALAANGLCVLQPASSDGLLVTVRTRLAHSSGQWLEESLSSSAADDSTKSIGSVITSLRRLALPAMVGVAMEDDPEVAAEEEAARQKAEAEEQRRAAKLAERLAAKQGGTPAPEAPAPDAPETPLEAIVRLRRAMFDRSPADDEAAAWKGVLAKYGVASAKDLDAEGMAKLRADLEARIEAFDRDQSKFRPAGAGGLAQPAA